METVASVIAFVTLTLTTIKSCQDLLSAVKDGPEKLRQISQAIGSLINAFEQIQTAPELGALLSSAALKRVTEDCNADFAILEKRLKKIEILPDERQCGILWKRLKIAFSEKELPWMLAIVTRHVDAVTLEVNLMQSRTLYHVERGTTRILAQQSTQTVRIEEQSAILSAVHSHVSDTATQSNHMRAAVEALTQRFIDMPSVSQTQSEKITERLLKLEEAITRLDLSSNYTPRRSCTASGSNGPSVLGERSTPDEPSLLDEAFQRLCRLADSVECTVESEHAIDFVNDLDTLLRFATGWESPSQSTLTADSTLAKPGLYLNQIRGRFLTAEKVKLNQASYTNNGLVHRVVGQKCKHRENRGRTGIARLQRRIRHFRDLNNKEACEVQEIMDSATFTVEGRESPFSMTLSTYQRTTAGLLSVLPPSLIISPILPEGHPVFKTIKSGQLDDLRKLLFERKAWLRARDQWGAPLIHYACSQPAIVRFLIENGADVNEIADCSGAFVRGLLTPLMSPLSLAVGLEVNCFKQLLIAGADPTVSDQSFKLDFLCRTPLYKISCQTDDAYLKATLDEVGSIYDLLGYHEDGGTLLHYSCFNLSISNVKNLLSKGVDINVRSIHNETCLIYLMEGVSWGRFNSLAWAWEPILELLIHVVRSGVDLTARAVNDATPSQYAYHMPAISGIGSFLGDIWDRALAACRHDVKDHRIHHPRLGIYVGDYALDVFKSMWDGAEELCPYFDNAVAQGRSNGGAEEEPPCTDESCPYYQGTSGVCESDSGGSWDDSSDDSADEGGVSLGDEWKVWTRTIR